MLKFALAQRLSVIQTSETKQTVHPVSASNKSGIRCQAKCQNFSEVRSSIVKKILIFLSKFLFDALHESYERGNNEPLDVLKSIVKVFDFTDVKSVLGVSIQTLFTCR